MLHSIDLPVGDSAQVLGEPGGARPAEEAGATGFSRMLRDFAASRPVLPAGGSVGGDVPEGGKGLPLGEGVLEVGPAPREETVEALMGAVEVLVAGGHEPVEVSETAANLFIVLGDAAAREAATLAAGHGDSGGPQGALEIETRLVQRFGPATSSAPGAAGVAALELPPLTAPAVQAAVESVKHRAAATESTGAAVDLALPVGKDREVPIRAAVGRSAEPVSVRDSVALHRMSMALVPTWLSVADRTPEPTGGRSTDAQSEAFVGRILGASPGASVVSPVTSSLPVSAAPAPAGTVSATPLPPITTPLQDSGFPQALGDRVMFMTGRSIPTAEIRMVPADLGPVTVSVTVEDGRAELTFAAHHPQTREAIEQALPRLREMLGEQGLTLGHASVTDQGVRRDGRDPAMDAPDSHGADGRAADPAADASPVSLERAIKGLIDTFA